MTRPDSYSPGACRVYLHAPSPATLEAHDRARWLAATSDPDFGAASERLAEVVAIKGVEAYPDVRDRVVEASKVGAGLTPVGTRIGPSYLSAFLGGAEPVGAVVVGERVADVVEGPVAVIGGGQVGECPGDADALGKVEAAGHEAKVVSGVAANHENRTADFCRPVSGRSVTP